MLELIPVDSDTNPGENRLMSASDRTAYGEEPADADIAVTDIRGARVRLYAAGHNCRVHLEC